MSIINRLMQALLRSSILWGALISIVFYQLLQGPLNYELLHRYAATHPVEYVEIVFFFTGIAVLAIKAIATAAQTRRLRWPLLGPIPPEGQTASDCSGLLAQIASLGEGRQEEYLVRRVREALEHVWQHQTADGLEGELQRLADVDAERAYADQGLLRLIIWAIPILGFLGTVVGITMALTSLRPEALEQSMVEVTRGLGVKFDTTAVALTLSMALMFVHFFVDRAEQWLLQQVGYRAREELMGRFEQGVGGSDVQVVAVRRVAERMLQAVDQLVHRQSELWQSSMETAQERWNRLSESAGEQLQAALTHALSNSLKSHAHQMALVEQASAEKNRQQWDELQKTLLQSTQSIVGLQASLSQQGEILARAVEASGEVAKLEEALNRNLGALAGAKHFEETVVSLAAAIHLLTGRLSELPGEARPVRLEPQRRTGQAA